MVLPPVSEYFQILECEITDKSKILETIIHADAWFHYAWEGVNREEIDSPVVQNRNVEMSIQALHIAHHLGCDFFADAGSRVEYGVTEHEMVESLVCNPITEYGKAKLQFFNQATTVCEELGMKYCHLRFFSVYGYGDHPWSIISTLLKRLPQGEKVSLSACQHKWNFMHIDDASEAVYQLYLAIVQRENFKTDVFNIASVDTRILRSFVEEIDQITGCKGCLEFGTFVQGKEGAISVIPDITKLLRLVEGWQERYSFAEGIKETLQKQSDNEV